jgi:hypothetical protein
MFAIGLVLVLLTTMVIALIVFKRPSVALAAPDEIRSLHSMRPLAPAAAEKRARL